MLSSNDNEWIRAPHSITEQSQDHDERYIYIWFQTQMNMHYDLTNTSFVLLIQTGQSKQIIWEYSCVVQL